MQNNEVEIMSGTYRGVLVLSLLVSFCPGGLAWHGPVETAPLLLAGLAPEELAEMIRNDPNLQQDGRFVGFTSGSTNLVPGDTNGAADVFVHDLETGATQRVSASGQLRLQQTVT